MRAFLTLIIDLTVFVAVIAASLAVVAAVRGCDGDRRQIETIGL